MAEPVVVLDGTRVSLSEARVSVFDRGFLYGEGVFEVLRAYGGAPFALEEHLERLERSCAGMGFAVGSTREALRADVHVALEALASSPERQSAGGQPHGDAYVRIVVTRGQGDPARGVFGLDPRHASRPPTRVVIAAPLELPLTPYEGVEVATVRAERATDHTRAQGAKITAYVSSLLALQVAQARGAYEAAFVAADGAISEGHASNLFVVSRGRLITPPLSLGILGGITRALVMEEARDEGLVVVETLLFSRDFERADEAFLTSSLRELVPITRLDGVVIGSGSPGPVTRALHARYRRRVRATLAQR